MNMTVSLKEGKFHVFDIEGDKVPIWEKSPGVFRTIEDTDPKEYLLKKREYIKSIKSQDQLALKKLDAMRTLLDLASGMDNPRIKEYMSGEQGESATKNLDTYHDKLKLSVKNLEEVETEFEEFLLMCGVICKEADLSNVTSILQLIGSKKP